MINQILIHYIISKLMFQVLNDQDSFPENIDLILNDYCLLTNGREPAKSVPVPNFEKIYLPLDIETAKTVLLDTAPYHVSH